MRRFIPTSRLMTTAVSAIKEVHAKIRSSVDEDPTLRYARSNIRYSRNVDKPGKDALVIDLMAEDRCRDRFSTDFQRDVVVIGEESLRSGVKPDQDSDAPCVLTDMIDGTDLLEMGVPLWCSAIIIFDPKTPLILGSAVGLATGESYYAFREGDGAYVHRNPYEHGKEYFVEAVPGPSAVEHLANARICFYGQKAANFQSVLHRKGVNSWLEQVKPNEDFRVYNFAGNPMMVKLVDRQKDDSGHALHGGIDAVFDLQGQQLHDVIPGAYIAKRAGAHLCDEYGNEIGEEVLAERLRTPKDEMKYILASTPQLAQELGATVQ